MTRTISKILATIAMVVVLPLMVVGTAFVAFFSTDTTITVSAVVDEYAKNGVDAPKLSFDGKLEKSHKITAGQNKTIEVFAQNSVGYTFEGWFAGSEADYKAAVDSEEEIDWVADSKQTKLSVKMNEAANEYVAVYSVVRYNIAGWSYKANPTQDTVTTEAPQNAKSTYIYGENLPTSEDFAERYNGNEWTFKGWTVQSATSTGYAYTTATFSENEGEGPFTLVGTWREAAKSTITYYDEDGRTVLFSEDVTPEQTYTLPSAREKKGSSALAGYKYAWGSSKDAADNVTSTGVLEANKEYSFYLYKEAITYTVSVTGNDAEYTKGSTSNVTFTVENKANLEALFNAENWTTESIFWEFGGLTYNGHKDATSVANAIVTENPETEASTTLTLVVVKNYTKFTSQFEFLAGEDSEETSIKLQVLEGAGEQDVTANMTEANSDKTLGELFGYDKIKDGTWYAKVGSEKRKVELTAIKFVINGVELQTPIKVAGYTFEDYKDMTLLDMIEGLVTAGTYNQDNLTKILENIKNSDNAVETLTFTNIIGVYNVLQETV